MQTRPFEADSFPAGAISEIVPEPQGSGISAWIAGWLAATDGPPEIPGSALVDGGDGFDPASHSATACSGLLWLRCRRITEVLKATDLIVRDGNIPFVIVDLCGLPAASLKTIPASAWWRLKQCCESSSCRMVVLAPSPLVPCATLRLMLSARLTLRDFDRPRHEILRDLSVTPALLRHAR